MRLALSELSSASNTFIALATFVVVLSTTLLFLGIGYGLSSMFRRGTNNSRSSTASSSTGTTPTPPVRKTTWGFSSPTGASTGRVKAVAQEINDNASVDKPGRKNSIGLPSIRGGSRPATPSSTKSASTHVSATAKSDHPKSSAPKEPSPLENLKKEMEEKVAELTAQIAHVKAEVSERESKLAESSQATERVKEELAQVTQQLEEARAKNEDLARSKSEEGTQMLALKTSHEKLRSLYTAASESLASHVSEIEQQRRRLDELGLSSLQDKLSSDDVVAHLTGFNAHIKEAASFMVEQFDLGSMKTAADFTVEDMEEAKERAEEILGPRMVQQLIQASKSRRSDLSSWVRNAFQAGMCAYAEWMVASWLFEDPEKEGVLNSVYESMRKTESSAILGLWKTLTHKYGQSSSSVTTSDLSIYFLDAIINVLIVSGFHATHMSLHSHITGNYSDKILRLVQDASRLNSCLGEDIVTHDLEVIHIPPDTAFDPVYMDIHPNSGTGSKSLVNKLSGKKAVDRVLCTLDLGLLKLVKHPETGRWENKVLVKPKVLLQSGM